MTFHTCARWVKKGRLSECELGKRRCQGERCTTFERRVGE